MQFPHHNVHGPLDIQRDEETLAVNGDAIPFVAEQRQQLFAHAIEDGVRQRLHEEVLKPAPAVRLCA